MAKILLVDDCADSCAALRIWLEIASHEVAVAHSGKAGIVSALRFNPDIVIADLTMPDMSGLELARRLCSLDEMEDVHLIACSGYPGKTVRRAAEQAGFSSFLAKPIRLAALRALLPPTGARDAAAGERSDLAAGTKTSTNTNTNDDAMPLPQDTARLLP